MLSHSLVESHHILLKFKVMYKPLVEFPLLCGGEKEDIYKVFTIPDTPLYLKVGITKS